MNGQYEWWRVADFQSQRAARKIQRCWRKYTIRKRQRQENALTKSYCPCPLCYFRRLTKKYRLFILNQKATIIQATWLGRLIAANSQVTEEAKLGYKMECSWTKLIKSRNSNIENELLAIETATRMSPECCIKAARQGIIQIMTTILNESNRSEAHKLRITLSISIMVNIYKFKKCLRYLESGEAVASVCIKIMKIHQRSEQIFLKCATLLALLNGNRSIREFIIKDKPNRFAIGSIAQAYTTQEGRSTEITKSSKERPINFVPYWCLKRGSLQQFTAKSQALSFLSHLLHH